MTADKAKRLLLVDDEATFCEVLKARLESFGCSVTVASNGLKAWQETLANIPDLILLDIRMPEEDGYTFLRKLRCFRDPENLEHEKRLRTLPVIVLTGTGEGMKPLFEQENIVAYIMKPVDSAQLRKLIEETLNRR